LYYRHFRTCPDERDGRRSECPKCAAAQRVLDVIVMEELSDYESTLSSKRFKQIVTQCKVVVRNVGEWR